MSVALHFTDFSGCDQQCSTIQIENEIFARKKVSWKQPNVVIQLKKVQYRYRYREKPLATGSLFNLSESISGSTNNFFFLSFLFSSSTVYKENQTRPSNSSYDSSLSPRLKTTRSYLPTRLYTTQLAGWPCMLRGCMLPACLCSSRSPCSAVPGIET